VDAEVLATCFFCTGNGSSEIEARNAHVVVRVEDVHLIEHEVSDAEVPKRPSQSRHFF